jgi:hypothetical protein
VVETYTHFPSIGRKYQRSRSKSAKVRLENLTKQLDCVALYVTNHDDSVLYYRLYRSGEVLDDYDSCPNYFEGAPIPPKGGNALILCEAFRAMHMVDKVQEILHYDRYAKGNRKKRRYVFEVDRHRDLVEALNLSNYAVGFGYTYLAEDRWPEGLSRESVLVSSGEP